MGVYSCFLVFPIRVLEMRFAVASVTLEFLISIGLRLLTFSRVYALETATLLFRGLRLSVAPSVFQIDGFGNYFDPILD